MKRDTGPPRIAENLLRHVTKSQEAFSVLGDYEEEFFAIAGDESYKTAKAWYWRQTWNSLLPFLMNKTFWSFSMIRNYLMISFRNIRKQKVFSIITISGLAVGLACSILILLYVSDELSYDKFHQKAERIFAVVATDHFHNHSGLWSTISMGPAMKADFPEIETVVRMNWMRRATVKCGDRIYNETPGFTDPEFFEVFSFSLIMGDPETALSSEDGVVLTQTTAAKFFGDENPMGKSLTFIFDNLTTDFIVTGVADDIPGNSTVRFPILLNINVLSRIRGTSYMMNWRWFDTELFVLLREGSLPGPMESRFPMFVRKYLVKKLEERRSSGAWDGEGETIEFSLHNIKKLHLNPDISNVRAADIKSSFILGGIAFLILVIACINFMNLSIGRASGRALEVGVRKVLGAERKHLIRQFWSESVLLTGIAMVVGLILASLLLPTFNTLARKNLQLEAFLNWTHVITFFALILIVGIVAGSYPALMISNFRPLDIFRKRLNFGGKNAFTQSLVVVQFALAIFLMIATFAMARQIRYMINRNLGFHREGVVLIQTQVSDWEAGPKTEAMLQRFIEQVRRTPDIQSVSGTITSFNRTLAGDHFIVKGQATESFFNRVYYDYLPTVGIKLMEGRDFSRAFATDTSAIIVNQAFVNHFGFKDPLGQIIRMDNEARTPLTIIGIVKDHHFRSLQHHIEPTILHMIPSVTLKYIVVRISQNNIPGTMETLEDAWHQIQPDKPFLYSFVDDDIESAYHHQQRWNIIVGYSTVFAVVITCMGIFALMSIAIQRRVKEIGIRKVLGAKISQVIGLLIREFLLLIGLSNVLAWPFSYAIMTRWLQGFAFRTNIGLVAFILSGLFVFVIASLTLSYHAIKAATINPVNALRYE